ncbi:MAG: hypothetical protein HS111_04390 [Kofleriaceae bacterium]|nr:hypothetical protein [Kofleriaceae bacterium]MCL4224575.1 hypothetical protein [Myxococcales bacterium]
MAPLAPVGRERAIQLVRDGKLPIWLGSPHPTVMILAQEGHLRIRALLVDRAAADVAAAAARRSRTASWMPEHYYALGQPTGEIFAEADSAEALVALMTSMPWPAHW